MRIYEEVRNTLADFIVRYVITLRNGGLIMIILGITVLCLAIMAISLICGKGSWMISGYNTMSKEEKANCDIKKISRAVGVFLLVIDILIVIMSFITQYAEENNLKSLGINAVLGFSFVAIVGVIVLIIYVQKYDKNNKSKKYRP